MSTPKISVIVPVYKAENYLCRCVDSLLAQTFQDFEILLIDDGSPDRSGEICDEYAKKDSRVRVFHKENGGVSSARQYGIDNACGEYSIHADPDDWVEPSMLEELYEKAKEDDADMVICDYYYKSPYRHIRVKQKPSVLNSEIVFQELFQQLHGSCWNKLVRQVCYSKYGVTFPKGINYCEDLILNAILLQNGLHIAYIPRAFYHYDQTINENSLVLNSKFEQVVAVTNYLRKYLSEEWFIKIFPDLKFNEADIAMKQGIMTPIEYQKNFAPYSDIFVNAHRYWGEKLLIRWALNGNYRFYRAFYIKFWVRQMCKAFLSSIMKLR